MSTKTKIYLPLIIVCSIIAGLFLATYIMPVGNMPQQSNTEQGTARFNKLINLLDSKYVDSVDNYELEAIAMEKMLDELDPHSVYLNAKDLKSSDEAMQGNFEGIGVQFRIEEDTIFIVQTIQGGPSEKVGIRAGDRIVKVNDSIVAGVGIKNEDVQHLLKGPKGTEVNVGIVRRGITDTLYYNIVRNVIPNTSVDIAYMIDDSTGFIKISSFSMTTSQEFSEALSRLKFLGMTNLILDLRYNGGGLLKSAIEVSSQFLKKNSLIVFTEGLNSPRVNGVALSKGKFLDGNLVILVNEASASASEIVAGAVQDHDRGIIVGRTTFGKGLVQEQMQLDDSSAVRITVARYHTPSGRCIQRSYANGKEKYYEEYYERYLSGELEFADSIHTVDTTKQYFTDNGRIVYGGGGITPDVFVPIEDYRNNDFYYQIINKSVIFKYAFNYTDSNRDMLMKQFPTAKDFINRFTVTPKMMNDILEEAEKNNITINTTEYQEVKKEIAILTKSYIGRNLFDYEGFYPVYNSMDKEVKKAVEVIHNGNY